MSNKFLDQIVEVYNGKQPKSPFKGISNYMFAKNIIAVNRAMLDETMHNKLVQLVCQPDQPTIELTAQDVTPRVTKEVKEVADRLLSNQATVPITDNPIPDQWGPMELTADYRTDKQKAKQPVIVDGDDMTKPNPESSNKPWW